MSILTGITADQHALMDSTQQSTTHWEFLSTGIITTKIPNTFKRMQQHYIVENVKMLEMSTSQHVNAATKQASSYSENNITVQNE